MVDAEIQVLTATRGPSPLDWRRFRRAEQRALREAFAFVAAEQRHSDDPRSPIESEEAA
ncbi:hypothetical protein GCM10009557_26860 [Virgisporangium ochraceum]